jgi:hypothetical protein
MKIRQLIKELQAIEENNGNIEVYARGKNKHKRANYPTVAYIKQYDNRCYIYPENRENDDSQFNEKVVFIFCK